MSLNQMQVRCILIMLLLGTVQLTYSQTISAISTDNGLPGQSFSVTITGMSTTWSSAHCVELTNGGTTFSFAGTASSATLLTGTISIPMGAPLGTYDVVVYDDNLGNCSGVSDGSCQDCFTVTPLVNISPDSGELGQSFGVTLTGSGTSWSSAHCVELTNGPTTISFTGTANSATELTGTISIPLGATLGAYDVVVYDDNLGSCSGVSDGSCQDCFTVTPLIAISPGSGEPGQSFGVSVTGMGTTWSSAHCVELTNGGTTFSFAGTASSATLLTGTISIPMGAPLGTYDVVVYDDNLGSCSGVSDGSCQDCFTVTPLVAISPDSGELGQSFGVTLTGSGTSWSSAHCVELTNGPTTISFTGTASSATELTGMISIPLGATLGAYDVVVYDDNLGNCSGQSDGSCQDCFTVTPLIAISPGSGEPGQSFGVSVTGMGTTWSSAHCVELTNGGTTFSFAGTASSATLLTGTISIPMGAPLGTYDVVVYDDNLGSCSGVSDGSCQDCFTVTPLVNISPDSGELGQSFGVTLTGSGTTWSSAHCVELTNGPTTISFTGTANSATELTGTISIPLGATLGAYDVVVYDDNLGSCSGVSDGSCQDCFTVTPLVTISPDNGELGQSFAVTLTGMGTTWSSAHCVELTNGATTISFTGIASSPTMMTGLVDIPIGSNIGTYDVVVYDNDLGLCSGQSDGSCQDCFTVFPSVSLSPDTGMQGETFGVTITGMNTAWSSFHCVELTNGPTTISFTGTASTSTIITGTISIPIAAEVGDYDVAVYSNTMGLCLGLIDGACTDCFSVSAILDVDWLSFKGTLGQGGVDLVWETGQERNSDYFVLEKSINEGKDWTTLGTRNANGNTNEPMTYHFRDINPKPGLNYYRLFEVAMDGTRSEGPLTTVMLPLEDLAFKLFPNPGSKELHLLFAGDVNSSLKIQVVNALGQGIYQANYDDGLTDMSLSFDVEQWHSGIYTIFIVNKGRVYTAHFVKN